MQFGYPTAHQRNGQAECAVLFNNEVVPVRRLDGSFNRTGIQAYRSNQISTREWCIVFGGSQGQ